jgi:hypothetical protein
MYRPSRSEPSFIPTRMAPTLLDLAMTSMNGSTPYAWVSRMTRLPNVIVPGLQSIGVSVVITRSSIAAEAVTTLKVEPGS